MKRNLIIMLLTVLGLSVLGVMADPMERIKNGFGATLSATTTPKEMVIRQVPKDDTVTNGTFASDTGWTKGTNWSITGGTAVFATTNMLLNGTFASTNNWTTNTYWSTASNYARFVSTVAMTDQLTQAVSPITSGAVYRIDYTVSGLDSEGITFIAPVIGIETGTVYGTNGTYSELITAVTTTTGTNFHFTVFTTAAGTVKVDNVSMRLNGLVETNDLYQTDTNLEYGKQYEVTYTVANMDPTTNTMYAYIGSSRGVEVTTNGTFVDYINMTGSSSQILFRATATNTSSFTLDNVKVREVSDKAYVNFIQMYSGPLEVPVYFILNGSEKDMTNAYTESRCMVLSSNQTLTVDDQSGSKKISGIWYRTASGTATAIFNGN